MKTIQGKWTDPAGNGLAGATLTLLLSQDATDISAGQIAHIPVVITLDENGAIPFETSIGGFPLETNDELLPAATYYNVTVHHPVYGLIYRENLVIAGTEPINLNTLSPVQK